jgi:dipeptidyl aminopeptidase/acylaminoacyl peptidase
VGRHAALTCEDESAAAFAMLFAGKIARGKQAPMFLGASSDGKRCLVVDGTADAKPAFVVLKGASLKPRHEFVRAEAETGNGALSPDGKTLAVAGGGKVTFIDMQTGKERRYPVPTRDRKFQFSASAVKFSPDGARLLVIGSDHKLRVLSVHDGRLFSAIEDEASDASGVSFSPDGRTLVVTGFTKPLLLSEVATGKTIRSAPAGNTVLSPNNRVLAIVRGDALDLVDLHDGKRLRQCKDRSGLTSSVAFSPDGKLLATACNDSTILLWDTTPSEMPENAPPLDDKGLLALWHDLGRDEVATAYAAIGKLIAHPGQAVPFLRQRLRPLPPTGPKRLQMLIADLSSETFRVRDAATRELAALGSVAVPALQAALAENLPLETQSRLAKLLQEARARAHSVEELTHVRAAQVLEQIATTEAQQVLEKLAAGAQGVPRTEESRDAVRRIAARANAER